ncbi:MAG TPA: hypothetical protein VFV92_16665 [Candidatus Bathyarchaeia archaeon]|nr:hypothetical protein [Candidatus Bathyarchaeia archaeon]
MANVSAANGLAPVRYTNGSSWNQQANIYVIPSTDGSQYGVGDIVKPAAGSDANGVPNVAKAAASDVPLGVIVGVMPVIFNSTSIQATSLTLETIAIPATKTRAFYVAVVDDPNVIFEIQCNNTSTLTASSTINKNANPVVANPATGSPFSGTQLDNTTFNTTNSLMFHVLGLAQRPGLDFTANAKLLVRFNQHVYFGTYTTP